jgi:hypothetical protein
MVSLCITITRYHKGLQPEAYLDYCDREKLDFRKHRLGTSAADGTLDYHRLFWHVLTVSFKTKWFYPVLLHFLLLLQYFTFQIRQHLNLNTNQCLQAICSQLNSQVPSHVEPWLPRKRQPAEELCWKIYCNGSPESNPPPDCNDQNTQKWYELIWLCVGSIGFPPGRSTMFNWRSLKMRKKHLWQLGPEDCPKSGMGPKCTKHESSNGSSCFFGSWDAEWCRERALSFAIHVGLCDCEAELLECPAGDNLGTSFRACLFFEQTPEFSKQIRSD